MTEPTVTGINRIHPFERAGLGQAPFRCAGHFEAVFQAAPDAPRQPAASCNYCGQGIMEVFVVRSVDGREFHVGCDCIRKVWREYDTEIPADFRAAVLEIERAKREARRVKREAQVAARAERALARLASKPGLFSDRPHPSQWHATKGLTLRDYYDWCLSHRANLTHVCQQIESAALAKATP